jgi:hypothetical protein
MPRPSEPLPDFIEPELAMLAERAPEGDRWLQIKIDGNAAMTPQDAISLGLYSPM